MRPFLFILILVVCSAFNAPEGTRYKHITTEVPQSIYILDIDPCQFSLVPARALDKCIGRETVLSISQRKGALAAFNGGFFAIGGSHDGAPTGILKVGGVWYGLPTKPRGAIGWKDGGQSVLFDRLLTHQEGIEFRIDPQIDQGYACLWETMDHVIGGSPLLIHRGSKITDYAVEKTIDSFLTQRHARTAVGLLPNGHWIFVVVDGKSLSSLGMTMMELANLMESLGCVEALNLDGGGSSTFVYEQQVINQPAGDGDANDLNQHVQRAVSDAILIVD